MHPRVARVRMERVEQEIHRRDSLPYGTRQVSFRVGPIVIFLAYRTRSRLRKGRVTRASVVHVGAVMRLRAVDG